MIVAKKKAGPILGVGAGAAVTLTIALSTAPEGSNLPLLQIMLAVSGLVVLYGFAVLLLGAGEAAPPLTRERVHGDFCEAVGDVISRAVSIQRRSQAPEGPPATWEEAKAVYAEALEVPRGFLNAESLDSWISRLSSEWSRYGLTASRGRDNPTTAIEGVVAQLRRMRNEYGVVAMTLGEKR